MKEEIEKSFKTLDSYMTELFHSQLAPIQRELVKKASSEIAKIYANFKPV